MAATHTKDLRTGKSLWLSRPLKALPQHFLRRDLSTDVLVVGAGISGALIADQLSDAGMHVTIVDRRGALAGSTPASTALLQYEIDVPLVTLAGRIGRSRAERVWRRSRLALEALRDRARHPDIVGDQVDPGSVSLQRGQSLEPLRHTADAVGDVPESMVRKIGGFVDRGDDNPSEVPGRDQFGDAGRLGRLEMGPELNPLWLDPSRHGGRITRKYSAIQDQGRRGQSVEGRHRSIREG